MLDLTRCEGAPTDLIRRVTTRLLELAPTLHTQDVMLVGAGCRDLLHVALGHDDPLRATHDIDLALALASWEVFDQLGTALRSPGGNADGIRFNIADLPVDLVPFGAVEDPIGTVTPPRWGNGMSVWAFREVFEHSLELPLTSDLVIRLPSVPGYAAPKLCAWLDRAARFERRDAPDMAVVLHWYSESTSVANRLYGSDVSILIECDTNLRVASAQLLGKDIAEEIGRDRLNELWQRWPSAQQDALVREMNLSQALNWPSSPERRREILNGLERGLFGGLTDPTATPDDA